MTSKPNILFIILDTQRRDKLSLYGHAANTSPHLDDFAQNATIFERAIAPAQWTIPSHGSMFTGVYPSTHMLTQAFHQLSASHPTLAEILRVADYHTAAFCNNPLLGLLNHGLQRGFDEFYNYAGATPNRPIDLSRSAIRRQLATWLRRLARYITNQFATRNFLFNGAVNPLLVPIWTRLVNFKGDSERSINDLIDYWQTYHAGHQEKPLFAFLNLMGTHTPYYPPPQALDRVAPKLRYDKNITQFMTRFNANAAEWLSPVEKPLADWQSHAMNAYYDAEIAHQDAHLGRLFDYLKQSGALDNTLVIIAADHGEGHGDHGFQGHSFVVFQELVHVPLLIHYPERFPKNKHITRNVSTRRLFHTILDITGITPPLAEDDPNAAVQDLSLITALNGRPDSERGIAYAEAFPPLNLVNVVERRSPNLLANLHLTKIRRGVYDGDHKLAIVGDRVESLFNVASDPSEERDVAATNPMVVESLQQKLQHFVSEAQAQRFGSVDSGAVSDDVLDNLRALGYFE
ncbi:MAG: sulfatase [Anaerolineae bacterium]|nr:sulfatase [Anaerolineae bacterium]